MSGRNKADKPKDSNANLGFEAKLWLAADKLRNNMEAAKYKHVVLGLIFLKYISGSFDEHHANLVAGEGDLEGANPEDKDEYLVANVFWVPKEARWAHLQASAKLPSIGKDVDDAMVALERDNPRLKGALNKNYGRADLDKHRLGELNDLIGSIQLTDVASRSKDLLGRASSDELIQFTDLASTGTKMPRMNWADISSFKVALPPKPLAAAFTKQIEPMVERITANLHQSRTLATLRDTLLSGEIRPSGN